MVLAIGVARAQSWQIDGGSEEVVTDDRTVGGAVMVGGTGYGSLEVRAGGSVTAGDVLIGANPGSEGHIAVTGTPGERGTLEATSVRKGSGIASFLFDGGVLRASAGATRYLLENFQPGDVEIGGGGAFIDTNGVFVALLAPLTGSGGLTVQGNGFLSLSGINTYQGSTTVDGGTLLLGGSGTIGLGGLHIASGGLDIDPASGEKTINGLSGTGTVRLGSNTLRVNVDGTSTYAGTVEGIGGKLAKDGPGTLELRGSNTYSGGTEINGGTLRVGVAGALGTGAVLNDGTLTFGGFHMGFNANITGRGTLRKEGGGALTLNGDNTYSGGTVLAGGEIHATPVSVGRGSVEISSGSNLRIINETAATLEAGPISGAGNLDKFGSGTLVLNKANTNTGLVRVNVGSLALLGDGAINSAGLQVAAGTVMDMSGANGDRSLRELDGQGTVRLGSRTLEINGPGSSNYSGTVEGIGGAIVMGGTGSLALTGTNTYSGGTTIEQGTLNSWSKGLGTGAVANDGTLTFDQASDDTLLAGVISGSGDVRKTGIGTLILDKANTWTGTTEIAGGTLALEGVGTLGTGALLMSGGTLDISGALGGWTGSGLSGIGTINLGSNSLEVNVGGADSDVFSGTITGGAGTERLVKDGSGTLILTGANTYEGGTEIKAGTLQVGDGGTTGMLGSGTVNVRSGATLAGGGGSVAGAVSVDGGGTLSGAAGRGLTMGSLNLGATSNLSIGDLPAVGTNDAVFNVGGNLHLDGNLRLNPSTLSYGTYRLFKATGAISDDGLYFASAPVGWGRDQFAVTTNGGWANLVVTESANDLHWLDGNYNWDNSTAWRIGGGILHSEWLGRNAAFDGAGAAVELIGQKAFSNIRFMSDGYRLVDGSVGELAISGSEGGIFVNGGASATIEVPVTGNGRLVKDGGGTLTLSAANVYSGGTTIWAGTLRGSATSFGTGGIENDGILHVDQPTDGRLAADVSGSGQLRKTGSGVLELSGNNSYTGGTFIDGWLKASADRNLGAPTGDITFSNGYLLLGSSFDLAAGRRLVVNASAGVIDTNGHDMTVHSAMTGNAYFVKDGLGTLTLRGPSNFTGRTTINRGTLVANADSIGKGVIENRSELVLDQSSDDSMTQSIEGAGSLVKRGAGRLNLTGTSALAGDTFVRQGNLAVNGSLRDSIVNVEAGGILSGTGTVGGINADRNGIVAPGNSIGTLNVAGNVTFGPGSFYDVEINGAGQSDRIAATGSAILNGGTVRIFADQGQYSLSPYTILTADRGVSGKFEGTEAGADFAFVTPTLGYEDKAVTLTLVRKTEDDDDDHTGDDGDDDTPTFVAFHSVAATGNQYNTADAVEALGVGNGLFDAVIGASASGARQAFDALSGEAHASAATTAYTDVLRVQDTILARLRNGSQAQSSDMVPPGFNHRTFALWGTGFGSWGKVGSNGNAASMDTSTGGFIIGAEARLDDTYRIGFAGGFMSTSFDIDARMSSGANETVFASVYGAAKWDAFNVRLGALYAGHDVDVNRTVSFPGFSDRTGASYDGSTLMTFGEIGYGFDLGGIKLEPFVGTSVMRLHLDGFREDGGIAALTGYGRTYDLGTTTLGLRAETRFGTHLPLTLHAMAGWRHAFGDVNPSALLAFSGGVSAFNVAGVPIDRDAFVAEAGIDWEISKDMTLGVSYAGQVGQRAQDHAVKGNFNWRFETW